MDKYRDIISVILTEIIKAYPTTSFEEIETILNQTCGVAKKIKITAPVETLP